MKRWVLVLAERGSDREGKRRRFAAIALVLGGLIGSWAVGGVLASDPIGYGVPFWPFADTADHQENALMSRVSAAVRDGTPLIGEDVELVRTTEQYGSTFWTVRLTVDGEVRCRELVVQPGGTHDVTSRRVPCNPLS